MTKSITHEIYPFVAPILRTLKLHAKRDYKSREKRYLAFILAKLVKMASSHLGRMPVVTQVKLKRLYRTQQKRFLLSLYPLYVWLLWLLLPLIFLFIYLFIYLWSAALTWITNVIAYLSPEAVNYLYLTHFLVFLGILILIIILAFYLLVLHHIGIPYVLEPRYLTGIIIIIFLPIFLDPVIHKIFQSLHAEIQELSANPNYHPYLLNIFRVVSDFSSISVINFLWTYPALAVGVLFIICLTTLRVAVPYCFRKRARKHINAYLSDLMLFMLDSLKESDGNWADSETRVGICEQIEVAARFIEHDLSIELQSSDIETRVWLRDQAQQISAGLRHLKKRIYLPSLLDTPQQLQQYITEIFTKIIMNNWGGLERRSVPSISTRKTVQDVLIAMRGVLVAGLLLVVTRFYQVLSHDTSDTVLWGYRASLLWLFLSILLMIDPNFSAKFETLRNVMDFIRPTSSDKKKG